MCRYILKPQNLGGGDNSTLVTCILVYQHKKLIKIQTLAKHLHKKQDVLSLDLPRIRETLNYVLHAYILIQSVR